MDLPQQIVRYGRIWPLGMTDLDIELTMFHYRVPTSQCSLGPANHFKNIVGLLWGKQNTRKHFQFHPWADEMLQEAIENQVLAVAGCSSSGKTEFFALWAIVNFIAAPRDTLIHVVSTSLKDSRQRIWGVIEDYWRAAPGLPGKLVSSLGAVRFADGTEEGVSDRRGIYLVAGDKSSGNEAAGNLIGKKSGPNGRYILICDEHTELSPQINVAYLTNLSNNVNPQFIGLGNPNSYYDAFGEICEPADGWGSITVASHKWKTRYGTAIHFDGLDSPNVKAGKNIYPFLVRFDVIERKKAELGEHTAMFWRMYRGFWCPNGALQTIFSEADIVGFGGLESVIWYGEPVDLATLDPSFTNGGDETILYFGKWGKEAETGLNVLLFTSHVALKEDVTKSDEDRSYQIIRQVKEHCTRRSIPPFNFGFDATGAGKPFGDILRKEWSRQVLSIDFGGAATTRAVSEFDQSPANERYANKVSEIWYTGAAFLRNRQLRGITRELARGLCERQYSTVKRGQNVLVEVESKKIMKRRINRSPDREDAALMLLDLVRERFRAVAKGATRAEIADPNNWTKKAVKYDVAQFRRLTPAGAKR